VCRGEHRQRGVEEGVVVSIDGVAIDDRYGRKVVVGVKKKKKKKGFEFLLKYI
jgi:hypothetical protein